jgi:hypothetical protein
MKKFTWMMTALLVLSLVGSAYGAGKVETGGQSLTIGGEVEFDTIVRDEQFDNVLNNPAGDERSWDSFVDVEVTLNLDWKFAENVSFFLQLENDQVANGGRTTRPGTFANGLATNDGALNLHPEVGAAMGLSLTDDTGGAHAGGFYEFMGTVHGDAGAAAGVGTIGRQIDFGAYSIGGANTSGGIGAANLNVDGVNTDFGGRDITLRVEQAYITVNQFLVDWMNAKVGLFDVAYSNRNNGQNFLWDLNERHPNSFGGLNLHFDLGQMAEGLGNWSFDVTWGALVEERLNGGNSSTFTGDVNGATDDISLNRGRRDDFSLLIMRLEGLFTDKGKLFIELSNVNSDGNIFFSRNEFGDPLALDPDQDLDDPDGDGGTVGGEFDDDGDGILNDNNFAYDAPFANVRNNIWTVGFGGHYQVLDWLQVYGEIYWQFGDAGVDRGTHTISQLSDRINGIANETGFADGDVNGDGYVTTDDVLLAFQDTNGDGVIDAGVDEANADGWAFNVGFRVDGHQFSWKPWVDVSFWWLTGDENGGDEGDDDDEEFHVYGNHNGGYIVEGIDYGYGINTNYHALKIRAGVTGPESDEMFSRWSFELFFGWYQVNETDKLRDNSDNALFNTTDNPIFREEASDDLGIELDLTAKYRYSDDLTFTWGVAWLFGSDFIEDNFTATNNGGSRFGFDAELGTADDDLVDDGEDTGFMFFWDVTLKF